MDVPKWLPMGVAAAVLVACSKPGDSGQEIVVFGAASLRDALQEAGRGYEASTGTRVTFSFGPSSALARQIAAAPRADAFLSASEPWMDHVERAGKLAPGTRRTLLSNRLVVVVHRESSIAIRAPRDLAEQKYEHLVLADPKAVPAGQYAKRFLESTKLGKATLWELVSPRVAPALDVRAALAMVERQRNVVGIVYRTDAAASKRVRVLIEVPRESHGPIRYPGAAIGGRPEPAAGRRFLDYVAGPRAARVFERHGFVPVRAGGDG